MARAKATDPRRKRAPLVPAGTPASDKHREVWRIKVDGEYRTVSTTSTSGKVMDEAIRILAPALKRLADR